MVCAEVEQQGAGGGDLFDVDFEHLLLRDEALPDAAVAPVLGRHLVAGAAAAGAGRLHLLHHTWCQGPQLHLRGGAPPAVTTTILLLALPPTTSQSNDE